LATTIRRDSGRPEVAAVALPTQIHQQVQELLRAPEREGRNDDVAVSTPQGVFDHEHQFVDGLLQRPMQTVAIGGLHHHHVSRIDDGRIANDGPSGLPQVA